MNTFESEIKSFYTIGLFENNLDESGNINLYVNPKQVNERYISFPIKNIMYDESKIETLYDVNIKEYNIPNKIESDSNKSSSNVELEEENVLLKEQLNSLISSNNLDSSAADVMASKDIIINLRIQLGQGKSEDDFSDAFPYIKK